MLELFRAMHNIGSWFLFSSIAVVVVSLAVAAPYVRRKFFGEITKETSAGANSAILAIVTFFVFILGSSLISVQSKMTALEDMVIKEASVVEVMNDTFADIHNGSSQQLRKTLAEYVNLLIKEEWRAMGHDNRSVHADIKFKQLTAEINDAPLTGPNATALGVELQKNIDDLVDHREERLSRTGLSLSDLEWDMIVALLVVLVLIASFVECTNEHILSVGGMMLAVSLFIGLIATFECPFNGETSVKPKALERVLKEVIASYNSEQGKLAKAAS